MSKKLMMIVSALLVMSGFAAFAFHSSVYASWLIDASGTLVQVDPVVLGEEASTPTSNETTGTVSPKPVRLDGASREQKVLELQKETEKRKLLLQQKQLKKESRIKNTDGLRVEQDEVDVKGRVLRTKSTEIEDRDGLTIEQPEGTMVEIAAVGDEDLEIKGQKVRTRTHFPITIGENNALIITKKDGTTKTVTFLPDAAVANLEAKGFISTGDTADLEEAEDGTPVYKFDVKKEKKLFGLFRTEFNSETSVSAESGEIVGTSSTESSPLLRFLERFAK